ncbi:phosphoglycerate mutase-like protein [Hyaloscypha bicolor E]|uniref:Phosphoglycerate mutase-like protein n=1 Tax=Hyaloscypha bicolor E TaxID=1095630 RepID=A0A2J6SM51_9HELO|nr:phosphoglycerate mutase-like protein [Hyaloscypha bicolor E]PMD51838.1 phosphoglycerate mutase-like protein [Hyaloscypha bicolor E]
MAPTVILIRHAQALHNVAQDYHLHDPPLSDLGFGPQCDELAKYLQTEVPIAQKVDLIVISPMRRTLQTAQQGLGWLMERGVPVILRAEWQENSDKPCDTGTDISVMEKEWHQFDWLSVDPEYPTKTGLYAFSKEGLTQRGIAARKWLRDRPEKVIAVVSHSGFLRVGVSYRQYANADCRIFDFSKGDEEIGGKLIEWELTEKKGGGLGKSPKGVFLMSKGDYPEETEKDIGEAVSENPT